MGKGFIQTVKDLFKSDGKPSEDGLMTISVSSMEHKFQAGDLVGAATVLRQLLEIYGERKKSNHRQKGREFIYFILSSKHKDQKNIGYTHWQNINKVIHLNQSKVYPYHQKNVEQAMEFFKKEIKGLNQIDVEFDPELH